MKTHNRKKKTGNKNLALNKEFALNKNYTLNKDFDPVKMMRDIRDKLTQEIAGMTYEQEKAYLEKLIAKG